MKWGIQIQVTSAGSLKKLRVIHRPHGGGATDRRGEIHNEETASE